MKRYIWLCLGLILCLAMSGCAQIEQAMNNAVADFGDSLLSQANGDAENASEDADEKTTESTATADAVSQYTVELIRPELEALMAGAVDVIDVFYVGVTVADEPMTDAEGNATTFYPVEDERFATIDELKMFTEQYYTNAFAAAAFYAHTLEGDYPVYVMMNDRLCRNADVGSVAWSAEWAYDTMEITLQTDNSVTVSMNAVVNDEPVEGLTITMVKVNDAWRLDDSVLD